jgi:Hypothetical protein TT1725
MVTNIVPVTLAYGDGIGPEIMNAALHLIKEAGARIETETIEIGERVYLRGVNAGIEPSAGFMAENGSGKLTRQQIVNLLDRVQKAGLDFIKTENLYTFDGQKGFVASQSE